MKIKNSPMADAATGPASAAIVRTGSPAFPAQARVAHCDDNVCAEASLISGNAVIITARAEHSQLPRTFRDEDPMAGISTPTRRPPNAEVNGNISRA